MPPKKRGQPPFQGVMAKPFSPFRMGYSFCCPRFFLPTMF